jgi:hypothetical protein
MLQLSRSPNSRCDLRPADDGQAGSVCVRAVRRWIFHLSIATESCNWTATDSAGWIYITSKDTGTGNGVVTFEARENFTGSARAATITISGLTQIQVQDGGLGDDCDYSISPAFQSFSSTGGTGSVQVLTAERCAWQAVATASWITITSSQVGIGNGTVTFAVAPNPGSGRDGSIVIAGKAFAVKQKGS